MLTKLKKKLETPEPKYLNKGSDIIFSRISTLAVPINGGNQ